MSENKSYQIIELRNIKYFLDFLTKDNFVEETLYKDLDKNKIDGIYNFLVDYYKKHNYIYSIGKIKFIIYENKKYCVDGKHRIQAYKNCFETLENLSEFKILIEYIKIKNKKDILDIFEFKYLDIPSLFLYDNENMGKIVEIVGDKIIRKFNSYFYKTSKKTISATRPKLYKDEFKQNLYKFCFNNNFSIENDLFLLILEINTVWRNYNEDQFFENYENQYELYKIKKGYSDKLRKEILTISETKSIESFFLGIFNHYEWVDFKLNKNRELIKK